MRLIGCLMFVVLASVFVMSGCDEERDGFKRPYLKVSEERIFTPSETIRLCEFEPGFVHGHHHGHGHHGHGYGHYKHHGHGHGHGCGCTFVTILSESDVEAILDLLLSDEDWRVEGQLSDGDESIYIVGGVVHAGGFTIDTGSVVKLQLWTLVRPNGHYPDGTGGYTDEVVLEGLGQ